MDLLDRGARSGDGRAGRLPVAGSEPSDRGAASGGHRGRLRDLRHDRPRIGGGVGLCVLHDPRLAGAVCSLPATKPAGEQTSAPTADVTAVTDPAGVVGSLGGSGGQYAVTGAVIFPQVQPAISDGSSLPVAVESSAMPDASLCPTILSDFEVREFPVPVTVGR